MRVRTFIVIIFIVMLFVSFTSFGSSKAIHKKDVEVYDFKWIFNKNIDVEIWNSEKTDIEEPYGIVLLGDFLYITDKENNEIIVLDNEGNFKRDSSESSLYLFEPTIIKTDGEFLYVIDSGYNQLKVLSKNFDLIKSINLPSLYAGAQYWDLEIVDKKIYLSAGSAIKENTGIYELEKNGIVHRTCEKFIGYLSNFNDNLMAINSLEYYDGEDENGQLTRGGKSGENGLFRVGENELKLEFSFVSKYIPVDFLVLGEHIYVFSGTCSNLDKYSLDGEYIETVLDIKSSGLSIQMEKKDNSILVVCPKEKAIYKINLN